MASAARAQELAPNAYAIAPVGMNLVTLATTFNKGDLTFDPSAPIEDARATIFASTIMFGRALNIAGRSAQIAVVAPYALGDLEGVVLGQFLQTRQDDSPADHQRVPGGGHPRDVESGEGPA